MRLSFAYQVAKRHFYLAHGIGRAGDVAAIQVGHEMVLNSSLKPLVLP